MQSEQHMVLKCVTYRVERNNVGEGKENMKGTEI